LALNEAAGFIRNGVFKRLQIHTVPTLHFHYDRTTERAAELSALINRAVKDKAKDADVTDVNAETKPEEAKPEE
jgi:ribosome-binding factor A